MPSQPQSQALDRFRALVMADAALQMALARCDRAESFVALARDLAARGGIALSAEAFDDALRPDPIGLSLFDPAPQSGSSWPGPDWLPIQIVREPGGGMAVDWAHFAGAPLDEPFFAQAAQRAAALPFNRLFRYRNSLDDFVAHAVPDDSLAPVGLIFHMSRCGSTLVSQMLAALPAMTIVSEPEPLNMLVMRAMGADQPGGAETGPEDRARGIATLRAMVGALGRRCRPGAHQLVLKLDSWHAMALPLFRQAFPSAAWIFLYRDPVEVLVSLVATPSPQTTPNGSPPHFRGIDSGFDVSREDYCARVLERVCVAAIGQLGTSGGLPVNYTQLPAAIPEILDHFGIKAKTADLAAMATVAMRDAKAPSRPFAGDGAAKRKAASAAVRGAAERHLAHLYGRLEALRSKPGL